jgi:hypothetical protein
LSSVNVTPEVRAAMNDNADIPKAALARFETGTWRGNEKLILSACAFPCHADDASGKILEAVWDAAITDE